MSRLPNVSLRQLEYFIAVAETRSFRRAADKLHVSQPTLTAQIASMEAALGARLFERNRSGTTQSALGRELLPRARRVIEEYRGLVDSVASLIAGPAGTYRFGVTPTMGPYLLPHVLPDVHREYAAVRFYIREDLPRRLLEGLGSGQYDFVIAPLPAEQEDFTVDPLFREELKLVVPSDHPLANRARITRNDMQGEEVLTLQAHDQLQMQIQRLCDHYGARVNRQYEGTSLDTLRQMVTMGMGLAFLPAVYIHAEIRPGEGLAVLGLEQKDMYREHFMMWRRSSPSRQLFRDLASRLRELIAGKLDGVVHVTRH
ncbi:MAG: LysR family transcriptional regulator [Gammaproteobacteria bacterium]|jgi:LysR family transcriptional regulator, hydrogen peroxide-inducible genes activator|nr:LysR family transcriptional regulator [Gammaproteobacteria bacterium]